MQINNIPITKLVSEDNEITSQWKNFHQQFINQVQYFLSDERYLLPHQPTPRATSTEVTGLNIQDNLGGAYYHPTSNNMKVNLEKYVSGSSSPDGYEFVPQLSFHSVSSTGDRDAIPAAKSVGKLVTVTSDNTKAYLYVNGAWRTITLT